jgi:hypothetical protein
MARISLDPPRTLWYQAGSRLSRRRYGVMLDPGAVLGHNMPVGRSLARHHVPADKIRAVPGWRDSDVFTGLERLVLEYAGAMTNTPPDVSDEMVQRLRSQLSEAELVELTAMIAVENLRSRMNSALGLTAQGFKDRCDLTAGPGAPSIGDVKLRRRSSPSRSTRWSSRWARRSRSVTSSRRGSCGRAVG